MKCEQAQEYVDGYINKTLSERTQEEFIKHVKACPECSQELETYFIVDVAVRYLEEGKEASYDIMNLLQEDMNTRLKKYRHKKLIVKLLVALVTGFVVLGSLLLMRYII